MNRTSVPSSRRHLRRLTAVVGGALLGAAAILTFASPASAHPITLSGEPACADTGWTANLKLTNQWSDGATVEWIKVYEAGKHGKLLADLHVTGIEHGTHLATAGNDGDEVHGTVAVPEDITGIKVKAKVVYDRDGAVRYPSTHDIYAPEDCAPPTTPPTTPPPSATPSAPASESPSAPASPSPTPGAGGGGPQLPTTGASIGTAVGIAVVLLAAGAGLFFFFRRRRIRFTA